MSAETLPVVDQPESPSSINNTSVESKSDSKITMAPKPFIPQESAKIGGQWEQLKVSESWAEKVKNVITHPVAALSIFYKERQMRLADSQLEYWKQEEKETMAKIEKTKSGIDKSAAIHSSLQRVQAEAGISLDQKKFREENRGAALERAKTFQETRGNNLDFVKEKVREIEEKKSKFTHERDMARKVFIDSYAAKVDVETKKMSEYDIHISEISGTIDTCEKRGDKLRQLMGELEKENREDLLGHDDAEYLETMRQLGKKENDLSVQLEQYSAARKQLIMEKADVAKKKEFWVVKITPPKPKETQSIPAEKNPEPVPPVTDSEMSDKEEENTSASSETENSEQATKTAPESIPNEEERPKNVKDAIKGLSGEIREADEDEFSLAQKLLSDAQHAFVEQYPDSKMFTWISWFFELFAESVDPKRKPSQ